MALTRLLFQLRNLIDSLIKQRIDTTMTSPYGFLVPSANQAQLASVLANALGVKLEDIELSARASADGNPPETHRGCAVPLDATQADALSTWANPGGSGYDTYGARCRRMFFPDTETTDAGEAASTGKTLVVLVGAGQSIPENVPLSDLRFTFDKLIQENGLVKIEDWF